MPTLEITRIRAGVIDLDPFVGLGFVRPGKELVEAQAGAVGRGSTGSAGRWGYVTPASRQQQKHDEEQDNATLSHRRLVPLRAGHFQPPAALRRGGSGLLLAIAC